MTARRSRCKPSGLPSLSLATARGGPGRLERNTTMVQPEAADHNLENDRLLKTDDVCRMMGCCRVTASKLMHETGFSIAEHGRLYIYEGRLRSHLKAKEGQRG